MPNAQCPSPLPRKGEKRVYNLADRTMTFAENIVRFARKVPRDVVTVPLIRQLVRSGTSIGANNREADEAVSRKDFRNRVGICRKEAGETEYGLQLIATAAPALRDECRLLWQEAHERRLIFAQSFRTAGKDPIDEQGSSQGDAL